jgi:hypothetical protein
MSNLPHRPMAWLAFLVTAFVCGLGEGCSTPGPGKILVSQPEVFTRQRLVNRRLTEQQWLENQLASNTPSTPTMQGYQDIRTFSGLYNKLTAAFDPLGGGIDALTKNVNLQNLQNQYDMASVQHKIDMLKKQRELEALQNDPAASTTTNSNTGNTGTSGAGTSGSSGTNVTPSPSNVMSSPPGLPSPTDITVSQAKITSIELLRDQLAWRNAVQAILRDQELDDAHDHAGLMLYTLKFDLALITPPYSKSWFRSNNDNFGRVQFHLPSLPSTFECETIKNIYDSWFWNARADIHQEAVSFQHRKQQHLLTEEETVRFSVASQVYANRGQPSEYHPALFISSKYRAALGDLITINDDPIKIKVASNDYYLPDIVESKHIGGADYKKHDICKAPSTGTPPFEFFQKKLLHPKSVAPMVFVTEPKEAAQNISDVAAVEQLKNMVLSLQAVLPQYGVNASNYTEYMNRSQKRLQGILRRPLLVAFSNAGTKEFGWILGPRWEIGSSGEPEFNHTPAQHSVQVSIVVPGWVRQLQIGYTTSWVDKDGDYLPGESGTLDLELPGDDTTVTTRLLSTTGTRREPIIETPIGNTLQITKVRDKQPTDILIHGQNLWRNPRVFIGAQPATLVQVLPDMKGLSARFNEIVMPPHAPGQNVKVDLSVVTSEGVAVLPNAVEIVQ